jgi:hypothetical protein
LSAATATPALRTEARQFSRYLIGAEPSDALVARYCDANAILFAAPPSPRDRARLAFAAAHPWAIPLLDAALAVSDPTSLFRKKLLVMMAILETTPQFAARTAPRARGLAPTIARVGAAGVSTVLHVAAGLALSAALRGRRDAR